jgi:hypothetical protein
MKISDVPKFESSNPELAINILIWNLEASFLAGEDALIFKNPQVDLLYRSKNKGGKPIYLLLIENSNILFDNFMY